MLCGSTSELLAFILSMRTHMFSDFTGKLKQLYLLVSHLSVYIWGRDCSAYSGCFCLAMLPRLKGDHV